MRAHQILQATSSTRIDTVWWDGTAGVVQNAYALQDNTVAAHKIDGHCSIYDLL